MTEQFAARHPMNTVRYGVLPTTISLQIREPGAALTHLAAFLLVLFGAGPLLMRAGESGSRLNTASILIFLISCGLLYLASTVYHTVVLDARRTMVFRKLDHSMIGIMIAGSYTPVCLLVLQGAGGIALLIAIWTLAVAGVVLKVLFINCPKIFSSILYLVMGWLCIFAIVPLFRLMPLEAFALLVLGGVLYSVGAVIYALSPKSFNVKHPYFGTHEIFHVFIMLGTLCHYLFMFRYIAPIR